MKRFLLAGLRAGLNLVAIALIVAAFESTASAGIFDWFPWPWPGGGGGGGGGGDGGSPVPEIDPASAAGALTMLLTGIALYRHRRS